MDENDENNINTVSVHISPVDTSLLHQSPQINLDELKRNALSPIVMSKNKNSANNSKDYSNMNEISIINKTTNPDTSMNTSNLELIKKL